jgi:hypothetical protein
MHLPSNDTMTGVSLLFKFASHQCCCSELSLTGQPASTEKHKQTCVQQLRQRRAIDLRRHLRGWDVWCGAWWKTRKLSLLEM